MLQSDAVVVSTEEEFTTHLEDADVLLFDKLNALNRLVQWGDNRPTGHVGVWCEGGVYEATRKPRPEGGIRGGVFHTPFAELMDMTTKDARGEVAMVRTVSALRYRNITQVARSSIREYLSQCTKEDFGVLDLVLLTPFALERSKAAGIGSGSGVPQRIIQACTYYAKKRTIASVKRQQKVFCSQLVYRAYNNAHLDIEIPDALYTRYHSRDHFPPFATGDGEDEDTEELAELLSSYQEVFEDEIMREMTGMDTEDMCSSEDLDFEPLGAFTVFQAGDQDLDSVPSFVGPRAPELGDMVTPGDFWSSPSFDCVAVLHRPAGR